MDDPNSKTLTSGSLFRRSYALYGQRFGQYLKITLFPAFVLFLCVSVAFHVQANMTDNFLRHPETDFQRSLNLHLLFLVVLNQLRFCTYWLTSAFLFGAVASKVIMPSPGDGDHAEDSSRKVLSRSGGIIAVGITTFLPMFLFGSYLIPAVASVLSGKAPNLSTATIVMVRITQVVLAGLLSKFGLAIPALIDDPNISVSRALAYSWQATANWEFFFITFLIKSSALVYISYWLTWQGLSYSWQHLHISWMYYSYTLRAAVILIGALMEIPLLIAFSVLYSELKSKQETIPAMAAPAIG